MLRSGYSPSSEFACRYCGKRYKWKSTMRRHEEDECGDQEPKFTCSYCPYKAKQKGNLKTHIKKHHLDINDSGIDGTSLGSIESPIVGFVDSLRLNNLEQSKIGNNDSGVVE